jgi:tetratricopeptide (TPR) repeat protein
VPAAPATSPLLPMSRISVLLLSSCLAACSAASAAAPASSATSQSEAARALFERGQALVAEGDSVRAEQYLAAALREGYDWQEALPPLLRVCLTGSRLRAGLNYATPYLKSHPDVIWLRYLVATVYLGLGQPLRAREHLLAIAGQAPYAARTAYLLGVTEWEGLGDEAAATAHFKEYLQIEPNGPNAREVSEWLGTHGGVSAAHATLLIPVPAAQVPASDPPLPGAATPVETAAPEATP